MLSKKQKNKSLYYLKEYLINPTKRLSTRDRITLKKLITQRVSEDKIMANGILQSSLYVLAETQIRKHALKSFNYRGQMFSEPDPLKVILKGLKLIDIIHIKGLTNEL